MPRGRPKGSKNKSSVALDVQSKATLPKVQKDTIKDVSKKIKPSTDEPKAATTAKVKASPYKEEETPLDEDKIKATRDNSIIFDNRYRVTRYDDRNLVLEEKRECQVYEKSDNKKGRGKAIENQTELKWIKIGYASSLEAAFYSLLNNVGFSHRKLNEYLDELKDLRAVIENFFKKTKNIEEVLPKAKPINKPKK